MVHGPIFSTHEKVGRIFMMTYTVFDTKLPPFSINIPNRVFQYSFAPNPGPSSKRTPPFNEAIILLLMPSPNFSEPKCATCEQRVCSSYFPTLSSVTILSFEYHP